MADIPETGGTLRSDLASPWNLRRRGSQAALAALALLVASLAGASGAARGLSFVPTRLVAHDVSVPLRDAVGSPLPVSDDDEHDRGSFRAVPSRVAQNPPTADDPVRQVSFAGARIPAPTTGFDGHDFPGASLPPDPNGDVGATQYVQATNRGYTVFSKSGTTLLTRTPAEFWSGFGGPCATTPHGDPIVLYDQLANRWVVSEFAFDAPGNVPTAPFVQCVAVSQTADATGAWYRYGYTISTTKLPDYPKLAVWPDGYYMSANQFTGTTYSGAAAIVFERSKMLLGEPAQMKYVDTANTSLGGMLPSDVDGSAPPPAGAPDVFLQTDDDLLGFPADRLEVWQFHVDWANPAASTFTHLANLATAAVDENLCSGATNCIPQPAAAPKLDAIGMGQLMYRLAYRNYGSYQSLVVTHTADVDGADQAGVRWYELRDSGGGWAIQQQSTYAPDTDSRFMSSAAQDRAGDIAVGYTVSSLTTIPSLRYTGRLAADPASTLPQGEGTFVAGGGEQTYSVGRWGDYSSMSVDPVDDCTFWFTGEYYAATSSSGWSTRIGSFKFPSCTASATTPPVDTVAPVLSGTAQAGASLSVSTGTWTGAPAPAFTYQWRHCDALGENCSRLAGATAATYALTASDAGFRVQAIVTGTNTNSSAVGLALSATVAAAPPPPPPAAPVAASLPTISGTAAVGRVLTAGGVAAAFTGTVDSYGYAWRRCNASGASCFDIGGATGTSYTLVAADAGSTIRVAVTATNAGGSASSISAQTTVVAAPAPASEPSGGGGGSAVPPDLALSLYGAPTPTDVGSTLNYYLKVSNKSAGGATSVALTVTLPAGVEVVSTYAERGSGCIGTGAATLACPLDFLPGLEQANVTIIVKVTATGDLSTTASVTSDEPDANPADNAATSKIVSGKPAPAATPAGPAPDTAAPRVAALTTSGRAGTIVKLRFRISDDRGVAKASITVKHRGTVVSKLGSRFGPVRAGTIYSLPYAAPRAAGGYSFCVAGTDSTGNRSSASCAPLQLRS